MDVCLSVLCCSV